MLVAQSCPALCDPRNWEPPGPSVHGILQARILEWVAIPLLRGNLPAPGIKPGSPALQAIFFTIWREAPCPPGAKSLQSCPTLCDPMDYSLSGSVCPWDSPDKNTGVGCPTLLQGIFLTQGSNPHLLHLLHWQSGFVCVCVCVVFFFFTTSTTWKASYLPWGQCKTPFRFFPD